MNPGGDAEPAQPDARVRLASLSLPLAVQAEEPFPVTARVFPNPPGVRDAVVVLRSPSGQEVEVNLLADSDGEHLSGTGLLPPFAESGEWRVVRVYLIDNLRRVFTLEEGVSLSYRLQVRSTGPVDLLPPAVHRVSLQPLQVVWGKPVTISAVVTDNLSGVRTVRAALAPEAHPDPGWWNEVILTFNPRSGRWEGQVYAPFDAGPNQRIYVRWLEAQDAAGNFSLWQSDLQGPRSGWSARVVPPVQVPPSLQSSATLSVLVGQSLPFDLWLQRDRQRVLSYLKAEEEPATLRATVRREVSLLAEAARAVAAEALVEPERGLPVVAPAATGKAWALAGALRARLLLLMELDRREARRPDLPAIGAVQIHTAYQNEDSFAMRPAGRELLEQMGPAYAAFIAEMVAASGIPGEVLRAPHRDPDWSTADFLPDGRIWVLPGAFDQYLGKHKAGDVEMVIPLDPLHLKDPTGLAGTVIHELGHHMHMVLMGRGTPDDPDWQAYLKLRGGEVFAPATLGHDAWPEENFAEDMVYLYAPEPVMRPRFHLRSFARQSYSRLDAEPAMTMALERFLAGQMLRGLPVPLAVDLPAGEILLPAGTEVTITGRWQAGHEVSAYWVEGHPAELLGGVYGYKPRGEQVAMAGPDGRFSLDLRELPAETPVVVVIQGRDDRGEVYRSKSFWVLTGGGE